VLRVPVPRVDIGSLIIKHLCNLDDRETVDQISENIYMQYFLGYSSFTDEYPFDASLFVDFRKRLGLETLNAINEKIVSVKTKMESGEEVSSDNIPSDSSDNSSEDDIPNKGRVIFDATACPQDISLSDRFELVISSKRSIRADHSSHHCILKSLEHIGI